MKRSILFLVLCFPLYIFSQYRVTGILISNNQIVANCTVKLLSQDKVLQTTASDEKGTFSFENLSAGQYQLNVVSIFYEPFQQELNHTIIKPSYHTTKPRKVCRQRPCVKDANRNCNQATKPRKVCRPCPYITAHLYKDTTLIGSPMIRHYAADRYHNDYRKLLISSRPPPIISEK